MDRKADNAFSQKKQTHIQTHIKIGKTEYIVNAHYADSMTLFEKLLRLMIKDLDKNGKPEGATLPYIPFKN